MNKKPSMISVWTLFPYDESTVGSMLGLVLCLLAKSEYLGSETVNHHLDHFVFCEGLFPEPRWFLGVGLRGVVCLRGFCKSYRDSITVMLGQVRCYGRRGERIDSITQFRELLRPPLRPKQWEKHQNSLVLKVLITLPPPSSVRCFSCQSLCCSSSILISVIISVSSSWWTSEPSSLLPTSPTQWMPYDSCWRSQLGYVMRFHTYISFKLFWILSCFALNVWWHGCAKTRFPCPIHLILPFLRVENAIKNSVFEAPKIGLD